MEFAFEDEKLDKESVKADYKLGIAYFEGKGAEKDLDKGVELIRKCAVSGYIPAQTKLADMIMDGIVGDKTEKQIVIALRLYATAAMDGKSSGDPHAQYMCATFYEDENNELALKYYQSAANGNDVDGLRRLGFIYRDGELGVKVDDEKSAQYFKRAADLGNRVSQYIIGSYYCFGINGIKQDADKAIFYLEMAIKNGYKDEKNILQFAKELKDNPDLASQVSELSVNYKAEPNTNSKAVKEQKQEQTNEQTPLPQKKSIIKSIFSALGTLLIIGFAILAVIRFFR